MGRNLAALDLWLLNRQSAYDFRYNPDQPRDDHGRFGEGDGGGDSGGGGGGANTVEGLTQGPVPSANSAAVGTNPEYGTTADNPTYRDAGKSGQRWTPEMGPPPSGAFEENCSNSVMAFEMRMRGYDVQAAPMDVLDKYGYAAGRTGGEMDQLVASGWKSADGSDHGRSFAGQQWRGLKDLDKEVQGWPHGGRGFINVGKHVFSVVNDHGRAKYIESQFGHTSNRVVTKEYGKRWGGRSGGQGKLIRLDDLVPTNSIFEAIVAK